MSAHSELALSNFLQIQNIKLFALQEVSSWKLTPTLFKHYNIFSNVSSANSENVTVFPDNTTESISGVALIISKELKSEPIRELCSPSIDVIWSIIKLGQKRVLVSSAYCTPPKPKSQQPVDDLSHILNNFKAAFEYAKKHKIRDILIYGDLNSRHIDWGDKTTTYRGDAIPNFI